jgi:hypothetical protein
MSELETARSWRRLFLNDDGTFKPDAEAVMRDLEARCGWMKHQLPVGTDGHVDPYKLAAAHEVRGVYAHAKKRLFGDISKLVTKEQTR